MDAKHIIQHLDEEKPEGAENEAVEQLVFADKVLLNKTDLVEEAYLAEIEKRIHDLNRTVPIVHCQNADVPVETVLNIGAFSLEEVMKLEPDFLDPDECASQLHKATLTHLTGTLASMRFLSVGPAPIPVTLARHVESVCTRVWHTTSPRLYRVMRFTKTLDIVRIGIMSGNTSTIRPSYLLASLSRVNSTWTK